MGKAPFVVFDGMDGSGKGTQVGLLVDRCREEGREIFSTREPGGDRLSEQIRDVFISHDGAEASALTQFLLMWAARANWLPEVVIPKLISDILVIADRSDSSTYAYQVFAKQAPELEAEFWHFRTLVFDEYVPSLYIIIDVPAEEAKRRVDADSIRTKNEFDKKSIEWYIRVREGFLKFAEILPESVIVIDGMRPIQKIHSEIYRSISSHCGWK